MKIAIGNDTGIWESQVKCLTIGKLQELLKDIPPDLLLIVNAVGNLTVITTEGEDYCYIDLKEEKVELFTPPAPA